MDTLTVIRDFLLERLDLAPEKVAPEAALAALGVDSLLLLDLMFEFEDRFDITLPKGTKTPVTVDELMRIVENLRPAEADQPADG